MSSDPEDRSAAQGADDADASADMQEKLELLDEHIDEAAKKAEEGRPQGDPQSGDDVVDDVAGGGTDHEEHVDDPEGPIIGPE